MSKCKSCGRNILWIKMQKGASMPCDPEPVYYHAKEHGAAKIVTPSGKVVSCEIAKERGDETEMGFVPHWATCDNPDRFKKERVKHE